MQTIELSPSNIKRVLSSLQAVFPNNLAIKMDRGNIAILSSNNPIKIDYSSLSRIMSDPKVSKQLTNVGINSPESLLAQILLTPATFKQITAGVSPNIDDTNKLEYSVGNTYEDHFYGDDNYKMFAEFTRSPWTAVDLKVLSKSDRAKIMTKVAKIASTNRNFKTAMEWSSESINLSPSAEALRIEGVAYFKLGQPEKANRSWEQALEIAQNPIDTLQTRALAFMYAGKLDRARSDLSRILELNPENKVARYRMATTYAGRHVFPPEEEPLQLYSIGPPKDYHPETVLNLLGDLPENKIFIQSHPKVLFLAAEANLSVNQLKTAERQARQYISVYPASIAGQRLLGSILYALGNTREGTSWWTASLTGGARYAETLSNQAKNQLAEGDKVGALHSLTRAMELNPASTNAKTGLQSMSSIHPQSKPILDSFQLKRYQTEGKKN
jgi:tetratricopeptide (TPR) repeat protein